MPLLPVTPREGLTIKVGSLLSPLSSLLILLVTLSVEIFSEEKQANGKTVLKEPSRITVMHCRWGSGHFPHADLSCSVQDRAVLRA